MKIKNLNVNGVVALGPMAGITFSSYRKFMKPFGVSISFTEMVSDLGIIYKNKETLSYTVRENEEGPVGLQLFGSEPKNFVNAIKILQNKGFLFDFIDINMGCPVPKVTKTGAGSSLLKNPKKCGEIIKAIKEVIDVPVTAKIRLGWDDKSINFLEVIHQLEDAGIDLISIHARTTKQLYSGKSQYELLKGLKEKMKVPLIYSGDIYSLDDAIKIKEEINCDGIMVARGGIGNPFLVKQIDTYFKTGIKLENPSLQDQAKYCLELAKMIVLEKGEEQGLRIFRSIGPKFFSGFPNSKSLRKKIAMDILTIEDLEKSINDFVVINKESNI